MDTIEALAKYLSAEGRVILDAPLTFGLAVLIVLGVCAKFFSWWYGREKSIHY